MARTFQLLPNHFEALGVSSPLISSERDLPLIEATSVGVDAVDVEESALRIEDVDGVIPIDNLPESESKLDPPSTGSKPQPAQRSTYQDLHDGLMWITIGLSVVIGICVALTYSPSVALNYGIGAAGGVVYLRMLGRAVSNLGKGQQRLGLSRLAVFVGLILLAAQVDSLQVLPIFFGFMTYKATLVIQVIQVFLPSSSSRSQ